MFGFWPAYAEGDDVVLANGVTFPMLRQQAEKGRDRPNRSLADFVAPVETGLSDHIGAFAVTAGLGADQLAKRYEAEHDDYRAIMVKALADRLAEAFAEHLHQEARITWGYQAERQASEHLVEERYRGIRPAFGYPACPDHSLTRRLFDLLGARDQGIDLTENCAMTPAASVSGLYLGHPESRYFSVGRDRQRPGRGLRASARRERHRGRTVASPEPFIRPGLMDFWHAFADMSAVAAGGELVLDRGEGAHVWDSKGRRYVDATAGLWFCNVGYGRRELVDAAADQMARLPSYSTFGDLSNRPAMALAERSRLPGAGARLEGVSHERRIGLDRHRHKDGASILAVARTARSNGADQAPARLPRHARGRNLARRHRGESGRTRPAAGRCRRSPLGRCRGTSAAIEIAGPENVAAFFCEPVIGAGGSAHLPGYLSSVRSICRDTGVLFVADEVITGFGRCGDWFASTRWNLSPTS